MSDYPKIEVLDKGYVQLYDHMNKSADLSVVNAARASYAKHTDEVSSVDEQLIQYLGGHAHTSPYRHTMMSFRVKAPLLVARQWWKYIVGSDHTMDAWNESSRRYITEGPEFYLPDGFRKYPESGKQGSGEDLNTAESWSLYYELTEVYGAGLELYQRALDADVCPEQARLFLPAYAMYVSWMWSASLQSVCHFINQRLSDDAQWEITQYAKVVALITHQLAPIALSSSLSDESKSKLVLLIKENEDVS